MTTLLGDSERSPEKRPGGDSPQTHDQLGVDKGQLSFKPWTARFDVGDLRCRVNSTLASLGETKVLDRIGDVDILLGHPSFLKCILQQPSSRTDKGNALTIFDVAWLLSDES